MMKKIFQRTDVFGWAYATTAAGAPLMPVLLMLYLNVRYTPGALRVGDR
jgi:hypothetical protein